jgi:hypothetical protein
VKVLPFFKIKRLLATKMFLFLLPLLLQALFFAAVGAVPSSSFNVAYYARVLIENKNAPASHGSSIDKTTIEAGIQRAYTKSNLKKQFRVLSYDSNTTTDILGRNLRGVQEMDRELCTTCSCMCSGTSYLCRVYCPGYRKRFLEVTLPEGEKDNEESRQLAIVASALDLESNLLKECYVSLSIMKNSDPNVVKSLSQANCTVSVSIS